MTSRSLLPWRALSEEGEHLLRRHPRESRRLAPRPRAGRAQSAKTAATPSKASHFSLADRAALRTRSLPVPFLEPLPVCPLLFWRSAPIDGAWTSSSPCRTTHTHVTVLEPGRSLKCYIGERTYAREPFSDGSSNRRLQIEFVQT
jgi:hypothetical protein